MGRAERELEAGGSAVAEKAAALGLADQHEGALCWCMRMRGISSRGGLTMPELKMASRIRICSGLGFHRGFGSGVRSSPPAQIADTKMNQASNSLSILVPRSKTLLGTTGTQVRLQQDHACTAQLARSAR